MHGVESTKNKKKWNDHYYQIPIVVITLISGMKGPHTSIEVINWLSPTVSVYFNLNDSI